MNFDFKKTKGFTLAEVLITLTIIGVIAALTIPNLMQKWQDQETVSKVKEAYSIINHAFKLAVVDNGPVPDWYKNTSAEHDGEVIINNLKPYLKTNKTCALWGFCSGELSCAKTILPTDNAGWMKYKYLNGEEQNKTAICFYTSLFQLTNGMVFGTEIERKEPYENKWMGRIIVDINGIKGPNKIGHDVFFFVIDSDGLNSTSTSANDVLPYYKQYCSGPNSTGESCGRYILLHSNTDYKYRDISAEW